MKGLKPVSVEPVQPVLCAKPQKAVLVLYAAEYGVI
jgi:hypothetical protein